MSEQDDVVVATPVDIEHRITEAKFEIVKERQMEFDVETDPETLFDLFGEDARSFADGPVWVYVLERRRAIEVWNTVMGDPDPQIAREQSPSSLRALYGITRDQNAVMGSPDLEVAEIQIASLFVSSPPFPTTDLPQDYSASLRSVPSTLPGLSSSSHSPRRVPTSTSGHSAAGSSVTNGTPQRTPFKAREIPISHVSPSIVPRTTRAADLRAGVTPPKLERNHGPRTPPSKEALRKMFADVPGHKRTESISVASTAPPVVAPRMTRASSLRISGATPPRPVRPKPIITLAQAKAKAEEEARAAAALKEAQAITFNGVPGHKRRESFSVASTKPPVVTPRQNRAAALRASKDTPPPSSYQFRSPVAMSRPSLSQSSSSSALYSSSSPSYSRPASGARRSDLPTPLALSNVRYRRRHCYSPAPTYEPSQQFAGTYHSAAGKQKRGATSGEDGKWGIKFV
ncbi:hypothetical protein H4582DRAFT_2072347 [Lactarius indigo]|nr:hypothetical protein H4582DRAFT_2072347 [Lactarius indigo]